MSSDLPSLLACASPTQAVALPPALRTGTIVYAGAVLVRHATFWSRAMLLGNRPNVSFFLALLEMATLVVLLACIVGRRSRMGTVLACAIVLAVIAISNLGLDLLAANLRVTGVGVLTAVWLTATRTQFLAIPVALLAASRRSS